MLPSTEGKTVIQGTFTKNDYPFYFKLLFNGNGWLYGFAWTHNKGEGRTELSWDGDDKIYMTWAQALEAAIEYAKETLQFNDVLITSITGAEYFG